MKNESRTSIFERIDNVMSLISGGILAALFLIVTVSVILRWNGVPLIWGPEVTGYMMVAIVFLAASEALRKGEFVTLTVLLDRVSSRWRDWISVVTSLTTVFFIALVCFYSWKMVIETHQMNMRSHTVLRTPLYLPQLTISLGFTLITIRLVQIAFKSIIALISRLNKKERT